MSASKPMHVPITGGMRQDQSEHVAPPGTLMDAVNVRLSTVGEIESRPGTTALSAATDADVSLGDIWNGTGVLGDVPGGFVVGSEGFAYRYDFGKSRLHVAGSYANAEPLGVFDVIAREQMTPVGVLTPAPLSQAAANGYVATVYSSGNGQDGFGPGDSSILLHVATEDGTPVLTTQYGGITKAWLAVDGSNTTDMVLVLQSATTALIPQPIVTSATGVTLGTPVTIGFLSAATDHWAVCTNPGIGWALIYQSGAAVMTVKTAVAAAATNTQTFAIGAVISPCSIYSTGTNIFVGWRNWNGIIYDPVVRIYSTALVLALGSTSVGATAATAIAGPPLFGPSLTNAGNAVTYAVSQAPSSSISWESLIRVGEITSSGALTALATVNQCTALSQPFGPGYMWVRAGGLNALNGDNFERPLLLDFMSTRCTTASNRSYWNPVIALTRDLFIGGSSAGSYSPTFYKQFVSTPARLSDGTFVMGIPRIVRLDSATSGLALAEWLRFSVGGTRQTTRFGDGLLVAGFPTLTRADTGTRKEDDLGRTLVTQNHGTDLGFPVAPGIQVTPSNGAGLLTSGRTYSWRAVLERIDEIGTRWRSAPSAVDTRTLGAADDTGTLAINAGAVWFRATSFDGGGCSSFVVHVYRTTGGGSTFYRASPAQGATVTIESGLMTYVDELSDALLATREILYTDGGVLANDCPPSCRFVRATEDRIWLGGLWETKQLQSSKIIVPGEPPQFSDSPAFRVPLPEPCTGMAYQDGTVIAFTRTAIYAIQGAGPNDQGQGAWDTARNITRSSGCVNHLSIVETSVGVFYQSIRGIELLPRGLGEPIFVGMAVQDTLGTTTVRSASVVSTGKARSVRFCYGATTAGSVNVLVYDLDTQAWSRDSYPLAISGICDTESGAVLATGDPDADAGYGFLLELDTSATDKSNTTAIEIASSLTWARLRPFGVAGMGRFQGAVGLFDAESPGYRAGNATVGLTVDSQTEQGFTFNMNTLSGASYRRVAPQFAEGTAGRLTLTTTVAGWRFMGWTVELEEIGGSRRVSETEQG